MKSNVITIFAALACLACGPVSEQPQYQVQPLQNGTPIMAGGEKGLSPMSFGLCYSNKPVGCAYITSEDHPDFFVSITSGMAGSLGLWWCQYDYSLEDGNTVYKEPVRVDLPWSNKKNNRPALLPEMKTGAEDERKACRHTPTKEKDSRKGLRKAKNFKRV